MKSCFTKIVVILLIVAGSAWAAIPDYVWTGGTGQYTSASNWDVGDVPNIWWQSVVHINGGGNVTYSDPGVYQNLGIWVGQGTTGIAQLTVTAGALVGGYNGTSSYAQGGWIAIGDTRPAVVTVNGGDLWANNDLHVGTWGGADATLNIMSGNVWAKTMNVGPFGNNAHVNISGGALQLMFRPDAYNTGSVLNIAATGNIDITGTGVIYHHGDATAGFQYLINNHSITAYAGLGTVNYEYVAAGDYTKVWATPEPASVALLGLGTLIFRKRK